MLATYAELDSLLCLTTTLSTNLNELTHTGLVDGLEWIALK